ncbi:MAG: type II toxin-antitoxin system HicA family toxin [Clostridia bacterium]|nr:type II toxin-antitoxin system HicA family toxin [Clostridia bacterium]
MPILPILLAKDVAKLFERNGYEIKSQAGSHKKMSNGMQTIIIPMHNKPLKIGTLKSIIRQASMTDSEFLDMYNNR